MRTYQIDPRPSALGGGWSLKLFDGADEMGGGVFPPAPKKRGVIVLFEGTDFDEAYQDALDEGEMWATNEQFSE